jgi:hypothetical protein
MHVHHLGFDVAGPDLMAGSVIGVGVGSFGCIGG